MILIGQYDSPFVRRVAVALAVYELPFEHRPLSTFGDAEQVARFNPLRRVPTLVLDDGEVLIESGAILDHLDERVGEDEALIARRGAERRATLKVCALATGLCDKMVALIYECVLHETTSPAWIARCEAQICDVLATLERDRAARSGPFWFGDRLTHADVATTCAMRFLREAHPTIYDAGAWAALKGGAGRCEDLTAFATAVQPFEPPSR